MAAADMLSRREDVTVAEVLAAAVEMHRRVERVVEGQTPDELGEHDATEVWEMTGVSRRERRRRGGCCKAVVAEVMQILNPRPVKRLKQGVVMEGRQRMDELIMSASLAPTLLEKLRLTCKAYKVREEIIDKEQQAAAAEAARAAAEEVEAAAEETEESWTPMKDLWGELIDE